MPDRFVARTVLAPVLLLLAGCLPDGIQQGLIEQSDVFQRHFVDDLEPEAVRVDIAPHDVEALRILPTEWVPATFWWGEEEWPVEVRLKGHGSFQPIDDKPSLKVKFREESFYGMKTLVLNNCNNDPTCIHQRAASMTLHQVGLPTARVGNTFVTINDEGRGLYSIAEDVDPQMLRRWFPDDGGTLYELFDGDFQDGLLAGFEIEEGAPRNELIQGLTDACALGDPYGWDAATAYINEEQYLRFWAAEHIIAQYDSYPYSNPGDDIYLYIDPDTDQFAFIAHGLDETFADPYRPAVQVRGILSERCHGNVSCAQRFKEVLWDTYDQIALDDDFAVRYRGLIDARRNWDRFDIPNEELLVMDDWFNTFETNALEDTDLR